MWASSCSRVDWCFGSHGIHILRALKDWKARFFKYLRGGLPPCCISQRTCAIILPLLEPLLIRPLRLVASISIWWLPYFRLNKGRGGRVTCLSIPDRDDIIGCSEIDGESVVSETCKDRTDQGCVFIERVRGNKI